MREIISFLTVLGVTFMLTIFLKNIALSLGIVDKPGKRKVHKEPIPFLGGLAIFLGFFIGLFFNWTAFRECLPLFLGGGLILILGLIDDTRGLSAKFRFIIQCLASLILVMGGIKITFFPPGLLGNLCEAIVTIIWLVGVTNAFNYLDGLDGLATGSAIINAFFFSLILLITQQGNLFFIAFILLASCLGFLPHNFRRAKIFLGDAGSTFLGFMMAGLAIAGNWAEDNIIKIAIPILILGVPIFDMTFTTIMRIRDGKVKTVIEWLKYGGKDHFHHYLVYLGFPPLAAVVFIWAFTFYLGLGAVMLGNDKAWEGILTIFQASIIFAIIGLLIVVGRRRRSGWLKQDEEK